MFGTACDKCEKDALHRLELKDGEYLFFCREHYNRWMCERLGYEYERYVLPKTITVLDKRYKIEMRVSHRGIFYWAYRGRKGVEESYFVHPPLETGKDLILELLKNKIFTAQMQNSEEDDFLDDIGSIGIIDFDSQEEDGRMFVYKGKKINAVDLLDLLLTGEGFNIVYHLEPRLPDLDAPQFTKEEHLPPLNGVEAEEDDFWLEEDWEDIPW